jgi:primase-polymerase (primpol)-like protein
MKTNEAPKKLYLLSNGLISYCRNTDEDVEYTRTDAFIEKAVKWLMDNIQDYTDDGMGEHSFVLVHDLKEHFKNYMKGE